MASVRMSQMLRDEIIASCLLDWDNAHPVVKYKEETKRLFSKLARKITPHIQDSEQWKLAKKFAQFKEENYADFDYCMKYNYTGSKAAEYVDALIEKNDLEGFEGCTTWFNNIEININTEDSDAEGYGPGESLYFFGNTEDHQAIPFPINFGLSQPDSNSPSEVRNNYLLKTEKNWNSPMNGSLLFECSMSYKRFEKLDKLVQKYNTSKETREISRREYQDTVTTLIGACTSVKQLLDKWPGADKYLPQNVKEKLASKTTRSNNTAEREEVFANIDMHNLNKTAVKASL